MFAAVINSTFVAPGEVIVNFPATDLSNVRAVASLIAMVATAPVPPEYTKYAPQRSAEESLVNNNPRKVLPIVNVLPLEVAILL